MIPGTDIEVRPERLSRVQRLYPGAVGIGKIVGTQHLVRAEVRKMENRGEIIAVDRFAKLDNRSGVLEIPYVRMKTLEQVRRSQAIRFGSLAAVGLTMVTGAGWLIWVSRSVLLMLAGATTLGLAIAWLWRHGRHGCSGIHCAGCRG